MSWDRSRLPARSDKFRVVVQGDSVVPKPLLHTTRREGEDPVLHLAPDVTVTVFGNGAVLLEGPGRRAFMAAGATLGDSSTGAHVKVWPAGLLVMDAVQRQKNPLVDRLDVRPESLEQALAR